MPDRARLAIRREEDVRGVWGEVRVMVRRSCVWEKWWMREPAEINRRALNKA